MAGILPADQKKSPWRRIGCATLVIFLMSSAQDSLHAVPPADSDPLLLPYLEAAMENEAAAPLAALFALQAGPIIEQILRVKRARTGETHDAADVASAAREYLVRQLTLLRAGERVPIRDFRSYVASVTYSAWAEFLRERHPQRAMFLNRLRYLLENRTAQKGFALWDDAEGQKWCGFSTWRERMGGASPKLQWLLVDPAAAVADALAGADPAAMILPELVASLLRWLGGPIELRDLTTALAEVSGFARTESRPTEETEIDPRSSPAEELIWKEYLRWLWQEIADALGATTARLSSSCGGGARFRFAWDRFHPHRRSQPAIKSARTGRNLESHSARRPDDRKNARLQPATGDQSAARGAR